MNPAQSVVTLVQRIGATLLLSVIMVTSSECWVIGLNLAAPLRRCQQQVGACEWRADCAGRLRLHRRPPKARVHQWGDKKVEAARQRLLQRRSASISD